MLTFTVIGNLGADARVENYNGKTFVSFSVAHTERWTDEKGKERESTQWVSCLMNSVNEKLLPHLRKGQQVFVEGRGSARVYSSAKTRRMEAGLNISVDRLQLLGARPDEVPHSLVTEDGIVLKTNKLFFVAPADIKAAALDVSKGTNLIDTVGNLYYIDDKGIVTPVRDDKASV